MPSASQGHTCPRCGQVFPRSENLRRHLSRKNPCIDNSNLRNSRLDASGGGTSYDPLPPTIETYTEPLCPFCGKRFTTVSNRNKHTRYVCRSFLDARMNSIVRSSVVDHLSTIERKLMNTDCNTKDDALKIIRDEIKRIGFTR